MGACACYVASEPPASRERLRLANLQTRCRRLALRRHARNPPPPNNLALTARSRGRRSNNHIYGQVIDDSKDAVVCSSSTMEKDLRESPAYGGNCAAATVVGKRLAERAVAKGITKVHFDRNGKPYHGRVAALADGAREGGLSF